MSALVLAPIVQCQRMKHEPESVRFCFNWGGSPPQWLNSNLHVRGIMRWFVFRLPVEVTQWTKNPQGIHFLTHLAEARFLEPAVIDTQTISSAVTDTSVSAGQTTHQAARSSTNQPCTDVATTNRMRHRAYFEKMHCARLSSFASDVEKQNMSCKLSPTCVRTFELVHTTDAS